MSTKYTCERCNKQLRSDSFYRHVKTCFNLALQECDDCQKLLYTIADVKDHQTHSRTPLMSVKMQKEEMSKINNPNVKPDPIALSLAQESPSSEDDIKNIEAQINHLEQMKHKKIQEKELQDLKKQNLQLRIEVTTLSQNNKNLLEKNIVLETQCQKLQQENQNLQVAYTGLKWASQFSRNQR